MVLPTSPVAAITWSIFPSIDLRGGALSHGGSVGGTKFLDLTLLAVLFAVLGSAPCASRPGLIAPLSITYRPLGKAQIHLAPALGNDSLVLLEAAADSAGRDGQVSVVAVSKVSVVELGRVCELRGASKVGTSRGCSHGGWVS